MDLGIAGKTAIVVGGAGSLGLAVSNRLAAEGANLLLFQRTQATLEAAAARLASAGFEVVGHREVAEGAAALGHVRDAAPCDLVRPSADELASVEADGSPRGDRAADRPDATHQPPAHAAAGG